ncbi:hypothetical protein [Ruminococcus flavefaciens]|uniref:Uncharacterized protein n=1 Tax=Ruminococcus flavefaciens TaxID=1265 RepID=A0A1M7G3J4_RUMFL|nr:hypothetical protein [Ruminococcus flavefaciens]SHM10944.1 hypothetical protein SAMN04487860_10145 [Ruminococcus flavefaciens]
MKCLLCAKEISEENAKWINEEDAICPECAFLTAKLELKTPADDYSEDKKNSTGNALQVVGIILWVLGFLSVVAFNAMKKDFSLATMIIGIFTAFTSGLVVYGMGEIIILLDQIKHKIPTKRK